MDGAGILFTLGEEQSGESGRRTQSCTIVISNKGGKKNQRDNNNKEDKKETQGGEKKKNRNGLYGQNRCTNDQSPGLPHASKTEDLGTALWWQTEPVGVIRERSTGCMRDIRGFLGRWP